MNTRRDDSALGIREPPRSLLGGLRRIGPGLIITASIVGSGELIMTTKMGAEAGYTLLWFLVLGCIVKVFVQIEIGRYTICSGSTTLETLDIVPGPRFRVSWLAWFWLIMYVLVLCQVSGIVSAVANIFASRTGPESDRVWAAIVAASCALLLVAGRYRLVERVSTVMVFCFTLATVLAVAALYWTDYAVSWEQVRAGFAFELPASLTTAFGAFGIIGVGASELIYYPYWCLEKGYARFVGPREDTDAWRERARGWIRVLILDAWVSLVVYTGATIAFYVLGASVLHARGEEVLDSDLISTLSIMYSETFGPAGLWIFLVGAFMVLYSTFFVSTASNARLFADALSVFGVHRFRDARQRLLTVKAASVLIPAVAFVILVLWPNKPVTLVFVGAIAQALMLPFLAAAAIYVQRRRLDPLLRPGCGFSVGLWAACLSMGALAAYQVWDYSVKFLRENGFLS